LILPELNESFLADSEEFKNQLNYVYPFEVGKKNLYGNVIKTPINNELQYTPKITFTP